MLCTCILRFKMLTFWPRLSYIASLSKMYNYYRDRARRIVSYETLFLCSLRFLWCIFKFNSYRLLVSKALYLLPLRLFSSRSIVLRIRPTCLNYLPRQHLMQSLALGCIWKDSMRSKKLWNKIFASLIYIRRYRLLSA